MQNKVADLTQQFPTPRLQTDDGNQDVADLHAREDLLLNNYSWVSNQSQGKVRIPIERAMELIAQRGLPVAPAVEHAPLMTGDERPVDCRAVDQRICTHGVMSRTRRRHRADRAAASAKEHELQSGIGTIEEQ